MLAALCPLLSFLNEDDVLVRLEKSIKEHDSKVFMSADVPEGGQRPKLNKSTMKAWSEDQQVDITGEPTLGDIEHLYQAIADSTDEKPWRESAMFHGVGAFSQEGKAWAKEHLAPISAEHGLPKKFSQMDSGHIQKYLEELGRQDLVKLMGNGDEPW
jgi:hypothetical protein